MTATYGYHTGLPSTLPSRLFSHHCHKYNVQTCHLLVGRVQCMLIRSSISRIPRAVCTQWLLQHHCVCGFPMSCLEITFHVRLLCQLFHQLQWVRRNITSLSRFFILFLHLIKTILFRTIQYSLRYKGRKKERNTIRNTIMITVHQQKLYFGYILLFLELIWLMLLNFAERKKKTLGCTCFH